MQLKPEPRYFKTILLDPPWPENGGGKSKRGADRHYKTMNIKDILSTIKECSSFRPHPDGCHMYMWTTNNYLPDAIFIMRELGFRYITTITWPKKFFGIGRYFRGQTEHILFGVRGKAMMPSIKNESTLLPVEDTNKHSKKPDSSYIKIQNVSPGPYLEMFARGRPRNSRWTVWGNEAITD